MISPLLLKDFQIFRGLEDEDLVKIAEICEERPFTHGERICTEGTKATHLHLCRSGRVGVSIWVREPWSKDVTVLEAEAGELFGWSAAVAPYSYTASVVGLEDGEEIRIKGPDLLELFDRNPRIGLVVWGNLSTEISARLTKTRQKLSLEWLTSWTPSSAGPSPWGEARKR